MMEEDIVCKNGVDRGIGKRISGKYSMIVSNRNWY